MRKCVSERMQRMLEEGRIDKSRIIYRMSGYGKERELLEKSVKKTVYGNLTVVLALDLTNDHCRKSQMEMRITREDLLRWDIKEEELWKLAGKNTPKRRPAVLRTMEEVLEELIQSVAVAKGNKEIEKEIIADSVRHNECTFPMYVLTNQLGVNGAAVMLYPGVLKSAAEKIGGDLIILPSSIHEVILLKWNEEIYLERAAEVVRLINREDVLPEDVLSDSVYVYRQDSGKIECVAVDEEK